MKRTLLTIASIVAILIIGLVPTASATDNAKWFVCKYEMTPGGVERLQTGNNPISVSENAIPIHPVVVGASFSDAQGRSYVLAEDVGQPEPPVTDCPPPNPPPTPTPEPTATPTPEPTPTPTPSPVPTPTPTPTPTPGVPTQYQLPGITLIQCDEPGGPAIVLFGFEETGGGSLVLNPGSIEEIVITDNGTYPLEPGTYTGVLRLASGEIVAGPTEFTLDECPTIPGVTPPPGIDVPAPPTDTVGDIAPVNTFNALTFVVLALSGVMGAGLWLSRRKTR